MEVIFDDVVGTLQFLHDDLASTGETHNPESEEEYSSCKEAREALTAYQVKD